MWKELGIKAELFNQEWKVYLDSQRRLDFSLSRAGWIGDYPNAENFLALFYGPKKMRPHQTSVFHFVFL